MSAYVSQVRGAEQRVHDCMHQDISVTVSSQALLMRDLHSPQDQISTLNQRVDIKADTYTHFSLQEQSERSALLQSPLRSFCKYSKSSGSMSKNDPRTQMRELDTIPVGYYNEAGN
jgi:hypothetical protein